MLKIINQWDRDSFYWVVRQTRLLGLKSLVRRVSASGDGHIYALFSVACLLLHPKGQSLFNLLMMSFIIELPLYLLLKNGIRRVRPCYAFQGLSADFEPSDKFSLPSGHTAGAVVMASAVFVVFPIVGLIWFVWAVAIGVSRVALAVHYPTDVFAGAILGVSSVMIAITYVAG
ncbi:phosphatase PAP2 family protein [Shewanella sp. 202IG2-18]|uniref:phosphatase PAP2 family protein n=1 Tax=Parashewanella hymeniacidonis TaxID=2807618 RepID=UPI001961C8C4|nr:phosphatase PAP2 family protein [Parashewanella hymeniacidonis]MBM7071192.1 phosphatase PAP2 family protein [Parashewanella hymeniacidonis]